MRFIILLLSLSTMVFYGKAVAGMGSYLAGNGRPDLIVFGLLSGTATAFLALFLWSKYLKDFYCSDERKDQ